MSQGQEIGDKTKRHKPDSDWDAALLKDANAFNRLSSEDKENVIAQVLDKRGLTHFAVFFKDKTARSATPSETKEAILLCLSLHGFEHMANYCTRHVEFHFKAIMTNWAHQARDKSPVLLYTLTAQATPMQPSLVAADDSEIKRETQKKRPLV